MSYPVATTVGALFFDVGASGTTTVYPTNDGVGGSTATAADGHTSGAKLCVVEGFTLLTHNTGENLTITDDAGVTIATWTIPASALVGTFISFGASGVEIRSGLGAELSTGTTARYRVYYRAYHLAGYGT